MTVTSSHKTVESGIETPVKPAQDLKDAATPLTAQDVSMEDAANMGLISSPVQDLPKGTSTRAPVPDFYGE
ncbi:MAG: hypothetical protein J0L77_02080 [Alphaproteobacteria bacterium]|nr:hypothetical protein [Alphaproteobacteria bacterium]